MRPSWNHLQSTPHQHYKYTVFICIKKVGIERIERPRSYSTAATITFSRTNPGCVCHSTKSQKSAAIYPYRHSYLRLASSFEFPQGRNGYVEARPLLMSEQKDSNLRSHAPEACVLTGLHHAQRTGGCSTYARIPRMDLPKQFCSV